MEILVKRDLFLPAALALGFALTLSTALAADTSVVQEAKKICLERYNLEKSGGTLPDGMAKSKYMSQCTNSIKRTAALQNAQTRTASANGPATQGQK
jgi:hypothetical protein